MTKEGLFGKTLDELKEVVSTIGLPKFTASQIADWLYKKDVNSIDEMHNLSKSARNKLNENYTFGTNAPISEQKSSDGTKKYLFTSESGNFIETAYIPADGKRNTLCVSSQVGCKMACEFCMTGRQHFNGNLSAADIVNQLRSLPEWHNVSNIVYMGMGEPLDNLEEVLKSLEILTSDWGMQMSPRRITVSTIGVISAMKIFLEKSKANLAISMHNPFSEERKDIMPVENANPIADVIAELKKHDWDGQRRVSFEYIIFEGLNHSQKHINKIASLLNGLKSRMNLIRFHEIPDSKFGTTVDEHLFDFQAKLKAKGIVTTIRASRGQDIDAACGLLSTKAMQNKAK
ncbi:MAG: 23S rRNA (adenine(2503)-C(2))-methyltransferase RlmN [Bacteroidetes bacterium]|nr:MAG: 23S rRNA (adenine(2503)-C(2))-methyltransferase RlmN [Bacteroidota bacterium]